MKTEQNPEKLPAPVVGLLIFMGCVIAALIVYWVFVVMDIMEQKRLGAETVEFIRNIYHASKFLLT